MELLVNISATHNQIVSIKSLGNTKQLNYANLSYNRITDMSPLSNIPYNSTESYLNISNNGLTLLSPLKMNIRFLAIYNNKITDYSPLNGMTLSTLSNIILDYSSSFDYQNLPTNKDIYIKDCALDKQVSIRNILGELNTHFVSNKECDDISKKYIIHVFEENADNDR